MDKFFKMINTFIVVLVFSSSCNTSNGTASSFEGTSSAD